MNPEEIKKLEREVNKLKFEAGQKASILHDLIEDKLLIDFELMPAISEEVYTACKKWKVLSDELKAIQKG